MLNTIDNVKAKMSEGGIVIDVVQDGRLVWEFDMAPNDRMSRLFSMVSSACLLR